MIGCTFEADSMLLAFVSLAAAAPLAECAQTWTARGVLDVVESADLNMTKMDTEGFLGARDTLLRRLECLNEPLAGPAAGAVHRVVATAALLQKQDVRIAPALAGLLSADPGYQLPLGLYPEGHPIRALLSHAGILARDSSARALVSLESGWLEVDGLAMTSVPGARAAILQQVDGQGAVVETRYVWPGDELGAWAGTTGPASGKAAAQAKPAKLPVERPVREKVAAAPRELPTAPAPGRAPGKARLPMLALTAASAVTTGILYGAAFDARARFDDLTSGMSDDELVTLGEQTNTLTVGYSVAGIASLGLGVGLAFAW